MKTTKKVISIVIALAFILSAFPMPVAFAEGEEYVAIALDTPVVVTATEENLGVEIFKFVAEKGGRYNFFSSDNDFDTYGEVYDKDMNLIAENDDGSNGLNFEVAFVAAAGETFYLKARGLNEQISGDFSVVLEKMPGVESVSIDKENVTGKPFDTQSLNLTAHPEDMDVFSVEWVSNDESVVKIKSTYNGDMSADIKLVGGGTTTVVATVDGHITATCTVTVEELSYEQFMPEQTKGITATEDNLGEAIYKFVPEESGKYRFYSHDSDFDTYGHIYDSELNEIYYDDDDGDGNNFYIEFDAVAGEVYYLKARPYSTETSGQYSVSVNKLVSATSMELSAESISGKVGSVWDVTVSFIPENAKEEQITWSSSDEAVVKFIYIDNNDCQLQLVGIGTATVTATSENGFTDSCAITVDAPVEIEEGETVQLECSDNEYKETYKFVPQATGLYRFNESIDGASYGLNLYNSDLEWLNSDSYMQVELTAGETYYYTVNAEKTEDAEFIDFSLVINRLVPATGITLSATEIKGLVATYETITAQLLPENAIEEEITWTSSNEAAVVIYDTWDNGKTCEVKIVGKGSSVLTATSESGFTDSCTVTADQLVDIVAGEVHTRYEDEGYEYTYVFTPEESGTYTFNFTCVNSYIDWIAMYDGSLSWLDNVSDDFQYEFTAGETYYFNPKAYVDYNQDEGDESYISLAVLKLVDAQMLTVSEESITDRVNTTHTLLGSFWPGNAITEDITWTSSDESVAKITGTYDNDTYCDILFVGGGTATITATSENGLTDSCAITVKDAPEIKLGDNPLVENGNGEYSRADNWYKFVPEEDGIYKFTVAGENIWDEYVYVTNVGNDIDKGNNISVDMSMKAGEAYYCEVYAYVEDSEYSSSATLRVEKMANPTSVVLSKESLSASYLQYVLLNADFGPEGCGREDISWYSSDSSVAYIENVYDSGYCRVFLNGKGTATITVESESGLTDTCTITVNEPSEISLNEEKTLSTDTDGMAAGSYKFVPEEDGTYAFYSFDNSGDTFGYVYNDEGDEICYDDDGGNNNNFFATFDATAGETYYFSARPFSRNAQGEYSVSVRKVIKATSISFKEQSVTSRIGSAEDLYVVFGPEGAVLEDLEFSSSDESVVMVLNGFDGDEGKGCCVSFIKAGTATITATTESGLTATCTVTVEDVPEITLGETALILGENNYYSSVDNYFKFIPEEDGTYRFTVSGENIFDENVYLWNDEFSVEAYSSYSLDLTAGQTCYVKAYADVDDISAESSAVITVEKLVPPTSIEVTCDKNTAVLGEEILLSVVFCPENSGTEDFEIEYSNPGILSIDSWQGETVVLLATGVGTTTVTVTTSSGLEDTYTITVKEAEDISVGDKKDVIVTETAHAKTFRFVPEEDGYYSFYSFDNNIHTTGCVFDANMNEIKRDYGGEGMYNAPFDISFYASAGEEYYLLSKPAGSSFTSGEYSVSVKKFDEARFLRLSESSKTISLYESIELMAYFDPVSAYEEDITWSVSDDEMLFINYAVGNYAEISAYKTGTAIITATSDSGLVATCVITVAEPEEITVDKGVSGIFKDTACTKIMKFVPEETGVYKFTSSIDCENENFRVYISGYGEDEALYSDYGMFSLDAGKTYYCKYSCFGYSYDHGDVVEITVDKCAIPTSMTLSKNEIDCVIGEKFAIEAVFAPENSYTEAVNWEITNEDIVKITYSYDASADFLVIGEGTATITAVSESGMTQSCVVNAVDAPVIVPDVEETVSINADETVLVYKFTPSQSGDYVLYSFQGSVKNSALTMYEEDLDSSIYDDYSDDPEIRYSFNVTAGETYYLRLHAKAWQNSCEMKLCLSKTVQPTAISFNEGAINGYLYEKVFCGYSFVPANAQNDEISDITVSNPDVVEVDDVYGGLNLRFVGLGTATVTVTTVNGLTDSVTVVVSEPPILGLDEVKEINEDVAKENVVRFIPEVSGKYVFSSISNADVYGELYDSDYRRLCSNDDGGNNTDFEMVYYLQAGKVYYLKTSLYLSSKEKSYSVTVNKILDGDINSDGTVDVNDYQQLVNLVVMDPYNIPETRAAAIADINSDSAIDVLDAWTLSLIINQKQ